MRPDQLDVPAMAAVLSEWLSRGSEITDEARLAARDALAAMGVPSLVEELDMARQILRFGNSFHSVARFFADGSAEQRYLLRLTDTEAPG